MRKKSKKQRKSSETNLSFTTAAESLNVSNINTTERKDELTEGIHNNSSKKNDKNKSKSKNRNLKMPNINIVRSNDNQSKKELDELDLKNNTDQVLDLPKSKIHNSKKYNRLTTSSEEVNEIISVNESSNNFDVLNSISSITSLPPINVKVAKRSKSKKKSVKKIIDDEEDPVDVIIQKKNDSTIDTKEGDNLNKTLHKTNNKVNNKFSIIIENKDEYNPSNSKVETNVKCQSNLSKGSLINKNNIINNQEQEINTNSNKTNDENGKYFNSIESLNFITPKKSIKSKSTNYDDVDKSNNNKDINNNLFSKSKLEKTELSKNTEEKIKEIRMTTQEKKLKVKNDILEYNKTIKNQETALDLINSMPYLIQDVDSKLPLPAVYLSLQRQFEKIVLKINNMKICKSTDYSFENVTKSTG